MQQFFMAGCDDAWEKCLPHWQKTGRVEDYPHGTRLPTYWPNFGKRLGVEFVKYFYDQPEFLVRKLEDDDATNRLIAYDLIELLAWEYHTNKDPLPECLLNSDQPIPETALENIRAEELFKEFQGTTVGEFLPVFIQQGKSA